MSPTFANLIGTFWLAYYVSEMENLLLWAERAEENMWSLKCYLQATQDRRWRRPTFFIFVCMTLKKEGRAFRNIGQKKKKFRQ